LCCTLWFWPGLAGKGPDGSNISILHYFQKKGKEEEEEEERERTKERSMTLIQTNSQAPKED